MEHRTNARIAMRTSLFDRDSAIEKISDLAFTRGVELEITRKDNWWESEFKIKATSDDPVNFALFMYDIDHVALGNKTFMKF